jgi:hypothetical protein
MRPETLINLHYNKYLSLILIIISVFITSCLKFGEHKPLPNYPISGKKWQQVKLRVYGVNNGGVVFKDTTYSRSAFDTIDYVQFNNSGYCTISSGSYYIFYPSGALGTPPGEGGMIGYSFAKNASGYIIYTGAPHHGGYTVYLQSDTLRIHAVSNNYLYDDMTDAYYIRDGVQHRGS